MAVASWPDVQHGGVEEDLAVRLEKQAPATMSGWLKKRNSTWIESWSRRHFVLKEGRLHWCKEQLPRCQPALVPDRSCIDFSRTPCRVVAVEGRPGGLVLSPASGHRWHPSDMHSRAGTKQAVVLDLGASPGLEANWLGMLRQHLAFARARASLRAHRFDLRLGLSAVDPRRCGGEAECAVCLEPLAAGADGADAPVVLRTPCGHTFHQACMRRWTRRHPRQPTCPTCRCALGDEVAKPC